MNNTEMVLRRVDAYLGMMRYANLSQERLSRLEVLNNYYSSIDRVSSDEVVNVTFESAEQLSKEFKLPLKVKGVFLSEGRPKVKFYSGDELSKSVKNPLNKSFPLMLDHEDKKASKVIGMVDRISYDDESKMLLWWGHINDETFARNVLDGAITQVSATIFSSVRMDYKHGVVGENLVYKELSLVLDGAEPNNKIVVDD